MSEHPALHAARRACEQRYGCRSLSAGVSVLVLALVLLSPIPASAQAITQAGGDGGTPPVGAFGGAVASQAVAVAGGGANNVLAFGGAGNMSFDVSKVVPVPILGATDEFVGFDALEKTGGGTWTLTGIGTFANTTTVNAGTLLVDAWFGSASAIVNNGATLGGHGTLSNVMVNSGGTLAPGNSIGTINVWNLTYNAGAIHEVELAAGGNTAGTHNDLTLAAGIVTIDNGAILHVTPRTAPIPAAPIRPASPIPSSPRRAVHPWA